MTTKTEASPRWTVLYGAWQGPERTAAIELQRGGQFYLPYVLPVRAAATTATDGLDHVMLVGTAATNPALARLLSGLKQAVPTTPGGFLLHVGPSPWRAERRVIAVAGADAAGVLHGVAELLARLSEGGVALDLPIRRQRVDALPDLTVASAPAVAHRGLWTWGYVIYDYRRFLDHMVRLKLNTLTMWNDAAPVNLPEILAYAHDRGIAVHAGFHWGWGFAHLDLTRAADRAQIRDTVLRTYREQYADLPIDGLYFQTLTEHSTQELGGRSVAAWCCDLVNPIARALWDLRPGLPIQFGLHATSIREHFSDLDALDPRLAITWEDAGALPFSYEPLPTVRLHGATREYEETLAYAKRLAQWRPGPYFAMVPKGWITLRWGVEFENHGPFVLGERDPAYIAARLAARQGEWDWRNQLWFRHYPLAARFYRQLLPCATHGVMATALVEDGLFEARIQPSVALFAETVWDPHQADADLLIRAQRPYLRGA